MNLKDLQKEMPYKWRQGPGGTQLAYIDSRDVQDRLDEVVGAENWQSDFKLIDGKIFGGIGIKVNTEWVWKWDCGTESNIEKEKGQISDALKRAGVQWGIGRFLYDLEAKKPGVVKAVSKTPSVDFSITKPKTDDLGVCDKCGAPMRLSQKGTAYCSALCWKGQND